RDDIPPREPPCYIGDPVCRRERYFRDLPVRKGDAASRDVCREGGRRWIVPHFDECPPILVPPHERLAKRAAVTSHAVNGKGIDKLVGQYDADHIRLGLTPRDTPGLHMARERLLGVCTRGR